MVDAREYYALIFPERECEGHSSGAPSLERECNVALNRYRIWSQFLHVTPKDKEQRYA